MSILGGVEVRMGGGRKLEFVGLRSPRTSIHLAKKLKVGHQDTFLAFQ
jgi:hypothetical protein